MQELSGEIVTLRPVTDATCAEAHRLLQQPQGYELLHEDGPVPLQELKDRLFKRKTQAMWEIRRAGSAKPLGYTGYRISAGYPFAYFLFPDGKLDLEAVGDCVLPLLHDYWKRVRPTVYEGNQRDPFMLYVPIAAGEELQPFLIENGFDPFDSHWQVDYDTTLAFGIWPDTYTTYFEET